MLVSKSGGVICSGGSGKRVCNVADEGLKALVFRNEVSLTVYF